MSEKKESAFIKFLASYRGKTLFNFFYGFGASIAILGTLFKILHLDGANVMLAVGLGTEVLMFAISAFEPPFRNYHWETVFPILKSGNPQDMPYFIGNEALINGPVANVPMAGSVMAGAVTSQPASPSPQPASPTAGSAPAASGSAPAVSGGQTVVQVIGVPVGSQPGVPVGTHPAEVPAEGLQASDIEEEIRAAVSKGYHQENAEWSIPQINISEEETKTLENSLKEYAEQMDRLNLHLKGLNTIYEIQLKDISSQIHTIDCINKSLLNIKDMYEGSADDSDRFIKETEAMAGNLTSLNQIYTRMLQAMMAGQAFTGIHPENGNGDEQKENN